MDPKQVDMEGLIDHLIKLLGPRFSKVVSHIYFGDIGVYLPESFGGSRKTQKAVIAIAPSSNRIVEGTQTVQSVYRELLIDIMVFVNITPFFEASPEEAYGERMLLQIATEIAAFLAQSSNLNLERRVQSSRVGDIDWAWQAREDQAVRGARIEFIARVRQNLLAE